MDEEIETLLVSVRADTSVFARDVAAMRAELDGPFAAGADQAGRMLENALVRALRTGQARLRGSEAGGAVGDGGDRRGGDPERARERCSAAAAAAALGGAHRRDRSESARGRAGQGDRRAGLAGARLSGRRARAGIVRADGERADRGAAAPAAARDIRLSITVNAPAGGEAQALQRVEPAGGAGGAAGACCRAED